MSLEWIETKVPRENPCKHRENTNWPFLGRKKIKKIKKNRRDRGVNLANMHQLSRDKKKYMTNNEIMFKRKGDLLKIKLLKTINNACDPYIPFIFFKLSPSFWMLCFSSQNGIFKNTEKAPEYKCVTFSVSWQRTPRFPDLYSDFIKQSFMSIYCILNLPVALRNLDDSSAGISNIPTSYHRNKIF